MKIIMKNNELNFNTSGDSDCAKKQKEDYNNYLRIENCKEEENNFNVDPCFFDYNKIYFMQYLSECTHFHNKIFDLSFDISFE